MNDVITEIKTQYAFLTKTEKHIADFIIAEPNAFIKASMAELALKLNVSQGSINNFSKKFCPEGFSALKLVIAACPNKNGTEPYSIISSETPVKTVMELKIKESIEAFQNTHNANSEESLIKAAEYILRAKHIEIYGIYHSGIVAKDFSYQLMRLGISASFKEDSLMCAVSASMLTYGDLVIAITSSGKTKDIIDAAKIAKENGATVLTVTCNRFSPAADLADTVLYTATSGMSESDKSDEIRLSQLMVLDTVCAYLRNKIDMGSKENFYRINKILNLHSVDD